MEARLIPRGEQGPTALRVARPSSALLAVLPLLVVCVAVVDVPLALLLREAFYAPELTDETFRRVLASETYRSVLADTGRIALLTVAGTLVLGAPLAMWLAQAGPRARAVGLACVVLPFLVSILVRAYAWIILLGTEGAVNDALVGIGLTGSPLQLLYTQTGVVVGTVHILLPFVVLPLFAALRRTDPRLGAAAASLGASPAQVLRRVTLPLAAPAALTGCLTVFVLALGFYVTPAILGGGRVPMIATLLELTINRLGDWSLAAALSLVVLAAAALALAVTRRLTRGGTDATATTSGSMAASGSVPGGSRWPARLLAAVAAAVCAFSILPVLLVIPMSFSEGETLAFPPSGLSLRWYDALLSDPTWLDALGTSALLALAASLIALVLGTAAAYGLARLGTRARGLLLGQFVLPLVVPEIVAAVALYVALARAGVLGSSGGLLLAHVVLCAPFVVIVMEPAMRTVDRRLEHAAWSLGASPARALGSVVLPLLRPSLLTAWVFAFIASFDALVITVFVGGTTTTLPVKMLQELREEIDPTITALSTLLILVSVLAAAAAAAAARRQRRRLGLPLEGVA